MSTWLVVWIVLGAVSTLAVAALLVALGRHVLLLGRTARRFREEVGLDAPETPPAVPPGSPMAPGVHRTRRPAAVGRSDAGAPGGTDGASRNGQAPPTG